ncbi:MAG: DUF1059 domain-containing protein [Actinophytocola sp.]|nr:DUF1059 domain-containing protein [Actinophytocola sp.]
MSYDFRCRDAGAPTCGGHITAESEQELRDKLTAHLRKHGVDTPNETLLDHLVASAERR